MNALVVLSVIALVGYALYSKWRSLPLQTKQLWAAIFGMAGAYRQMKKQQQGNASYPNESKGSTHGNGHLTVACTQCGLHVPENEGIRSHGQFYCCAEHAQ